ncbi:MAG: hypothetical protein ACTSXH_06100 [Promethearchaeota archaeon]
MPKCLVCGKELKNPKSKSHINSKFHQEKLNKSGKKDVKKIESSVKTDEISLLKKLIENLDRRLSIIEERLNVSNTSITSQTYKPLNNKKIADMIVKTIKEKTSSHRIRRNLTLIDLKEEITDMVQISDQEFEEIILRLYRKQVVDLQSGGKPTEYHIRSPIGNKFYYIALKI